MKIKKINKVSLNLFSGIVLQTINILNTFLLPKIMLYYFGSEVNGLVASLNQFLGYVSLLEGGITGVTVASLYKPLYEKDNKKISSIIKTVDRFYKKIAIIIVVYSLFISSVYPLLIKSSFNYIYVLLLGLILSSNYIIQYAITLTYRSLLMADGKNYVISITQIIVVLTNLVISYISVLLFPSIHIFKLICSLLMLIYPIVYKKYIYKNYNLSFNNVETDDSLLKNRWNGFYINLATFIHFSTDIVILTIFTDLYIVSIYSVYSIVTSGIEAFVRIICKSFTPIIGKAIARGKIDELDSKFNDFESIMFFIIFVVFTVSIKLIVPFVMIYTSSIKDVDYYQNLFGILLIISEILYLIRMPHYELASAANKYKEMTIPSFVEALINISISLLLVSKNKLNGVATGTIVAMFFGLIYQIYLTSIIINKKRAITTIKKIMVYIFVTIALQYIFKIIGNVEYNIGSWIYFATIYSLIAIYFHYFTQKILFNFSIVKQIKNMNKE